MNQTAYTDTCAEDILCAQPSRVMSAQDRCDACGARAWVRAVMKTSELLFCGHHANEHMSALQKTALFVQDERTHFH